MFIYTTQHFCCVVVPEFDERGNLPPGIHRASWNEIMKRFGTNPHRKDMLEKLLIALDSLKKAGCKKFYLDGSFVTSKRFPNDYDCCWESTGVDHNRLHRIFMDCSPSGRQRQKFIFKGEFIPSSTIEGVTNTPFLEFFQIDKITQEPKGIIELNLEDLS